MCNARFIFLGLVAGAVLGRLEAQLVPRPLTFTAAPPPGTLMVTQSVQTASVRVEAVGQFTNLTASVTVQGTPSTLLDDGGPPDAAGGDGVFTGSFGVPAFGGATAFVAAFVVTGFDVAVTNDLGELLPEAWVSNRLDVTYQAQVRPGNDAFTNAFKIGPVGGWVAGNNTLASLEPAEPFHGDDPLVAASIWWTWSPTNQTRVFMDTAGSAFAPVLAVYTGSSLPNLRRVAASTNDLVNQLKANVTFDAQAGVTYRIAVAGYDATGVGAVRLGVIPGGAPDTQGPLVNIMYPPSESLFATNRVWVTGTAKDPEPHATGVQQVTVQLNDDPPVVAEGTARWNLELLLPPGTNVVRAVAQDIAGNLGRPSVAVVRYVDPLNDLFADAFELTELSGVVTAVNTLATREPGEPRHAGNEGGHSVWYWFQAPASGSLQLSTRDSGFDTLLGVYTGASVDALALVGANDDAAEGSGYSELVLPLVRGQVYRIAVDGFGEGTGFLRLRWTFTTLETFYSLTLLPSLGGTAMPPSGLYPEGSTQIVTALPARDFVFTGWQGSLDTLQNPLTLVLTQNYTLAATFQVAGYTDGFESGGFSGELPWASFGPARWLVQSERAWEGRYAARSGAISDGQQSALVLQLPLMDGTGAFRLRVSSEVGWDGLEFHLNGQLLERWSGEIDWRNYQFAVKEGVNTLEWRYVKDANYSEGSDAAFLDNLYLPLPDQAVSAELSLAAVPDQGAQVVVQGYPGRAYILQASPDLRQWTPVYTNATESGSWVWLDPWAAVPARYYRAQLR